MAATAEARPQSIEVRVGGRLYPVNLRGRAPAAEIPAPAPDVKKSPGARERLPEDLRGRLAFTRLTAAEREDRTRLVQAYVESLNFLDRCAADAQRLIERVCRTNLEFRQGRGPTHEGALREAFDAKLREMIARAQFSGASAANVLDANLVALPPELLRVRLDAALRGAVGDFVKRFFAACERLVDGQVVGLVEWGEENTCFYHFYKEVLVQENEGLRIERGRKRRKVRIDGRTQTTTTRQNVREITEGSHLHRVARHEHHVMNAFQTSIADTKVVIPQNVAPLLREIPDWLRPHVRVIDGEIFRERIIEQDLKTVGWRETKRRTETTTQTELLPAPRVWDDPVYGDEPAVILDEFVLTGWGPTEIAAELARRDAAAGTRRRARSEASYGRRALLLAGLAPVTALASVVCVWLAFRAVPAFALLAAAMASIAVGLLVVAASDAGRALGRPLPALFTLSAAGALLFATIGLQLAVTAYQAASVAAGLGGVAAFALAGGAVRVAATAAPVEWRQFLPGAPER